VRSAEAARLFKDSSKQAVMNKSAARSSAAAFLLRWPKKGAGRRGLDDRAVVQGRVRGEQEEGGRKGGCSCENDNRYRV
jgi:hypothetical protein